MMSFLKSFLTGEKSVEEKAILAGQQKKRDVMTVDAFAADEEEVSGEEACQTTYSGCGGCGCRQ